jgi:8-oxo-dGTP diphosphatase
VNPADDRDWNGAPVFGARVDGCPYIVRPSAYAILRNAAGQFALARTPKGGFLLGGGGDPGETPGQTVEREAREECGLLLKTGAVLGRAIDIVHSADEHACVEKRSVFIEAEIVGTVAPLEHDHELAWLDRDQAIAALQPESHRWALAAPKPGA